ncbi:hypothetical protein [Pseudomonas coronafaciens]|uniref:Uncharacterized protein n=1 Tax=Pseudomonas coronafaciens pv. coronafaciens TaxID=235275 RepID=A0AAE6UQN5_9PSED|nr:hypothetical protein [Pseudomonas coronafaciens]QGT83488.1 hypothetical protein GMO17_21120 [Pseudomonas coronafaciens pv. coronafaciens]QIQ71301.1 hypothetical protein HBB04_01666 [Pseudomonas coronafaciens]RMM80001.1 hypothetical protein ALQ71_00696 [Pseudomonas coronafaciens pv. striafaciens]
MKLLIPGAVALVLLSGVTVAAPAAPVSVSPMHEQYLPPDDLSLRDGAPEQQQLMQVTEYTIVAGNQRQSSQQPIPVTSPLSLRLNGKSLNRGASISQVLVHFDGGESKSLKKPTYDEPSRTLTLYYPLSQYRVLVDLLRNEKVYCQYLSYANGHIWADLHTTSARTR